MASGAVLRKGKVVGSTPTIGSDQMKKASRLQRLAFKEERAVIKRVIYLSGISLILAIFIFTFGIPLLGKFADFLNTIFGGGEQKITNFQTLAPGIPRPNPLPQAVNSRQLTISGYSDAQTTVVVYLNSKEAGSVNTLDGKFRLENLTLEEGKNEIWAKAINRQGTESSPSIILAIILDTVEPKIELLGPSEGQTFSGDNRIKVFGKTDGDAQVFANGFLASSDLEGNFEVLVPLTDGENTIEIKAADLAGNTRVEIRKVNFRK